MARRDIAITVILALIGFGVQAGNEFKFNDWAIAFWVFAPLYAGLVWGVLPWWAQRRDTKSLTVLGLQLPPKAQVKPEELPNIGIAKRDAPDATLKLVRDGEYVYVDVFNGGKRAAEFQSMIRATGMKQWPKHDVFGRWDAVPAARCEIARGSNARLRIARWVTTGSTASVTTCHWVVYFATDTSPEERDSLCSQVLLSDPPTTGWQVSIDVSVVAIPDPVNGPQRCRVALRGDGTVEGIFDLSEPRRSSPSSDVALLSGQQG